MFSIVVSPEFQYYCFMPRDFPMMKTFFKLQNQNLRFSNYNVKEIIEKTMYLTEMTIDHSHEISYNCRKMPFVYRADVGLFINDTNHRTRTMNEFN